MNYATAEVCTANIEATAAHNMDARTLEWDDMGDLEQCGEVSMIMLLRYLSPGRGRWKLYWLLIVSSSHFMEIVSLSGMCCR